MKNTFVLSLVLWFLIGIVTKKIYAQDNNFNYSFESKFLGGTGDELPYWLHANQHGTVDPQSSNFLNTLIAKGELFNYGDLSISTKAHLNIRLSEQESIHFSELYLAANYGTFEMTFGRKYEPIGLNNHALSAGSMMVSNNAIPLNKITLSTPNFENIPFTDGWMEYKGQFSHGWFSGNRDVEDPYLHQKYLYLRLNIEKFSATGGIVHNTVWGGTSPDHGQLPQSLGDYFRVITATGADEDSDAPPGEINNVIGNSVAAYDFAAAYEFDKFDLSLTRLFYLEDGVSTRFRSPWDGVWGANIQFNDSSSPITAFTYEHINTKQQDAKSDQEIGRASYYNHSIYRSGWTHFGRVLGLPLITINQGNGRTIGNNIIVGHHAGFEGQVTNRLQYKMMGTYSRNYGIGVGKAPRGTIDFEERREDQYSFLMETNYKLSSAENIQLSFSAALDSGTFRESSAGAMIGIRWGNAFSD